MGEANCNSKTDLKKGPWTREEDQKLLAYIQEHGYGSWRTLPAAAGLQRCGKSCRLRWTNYLRPDIRRGKFSSHEEKTIIRLHALLGNRWSAIAGHLPKRTDNEIKNYWNTRLKKRLTRMGIDPATHKPKAGSTLTHMAQWEAARLEAEARLARQSNLFRINNFKPPLFRRQPTFFNSPTSTLNFSCNVNAAPAPTVVNNTNELYACGGVVLDQDCYTDMQPQLHVDVYPTEFLGIPVDQLADGYDNININPQLQLVGDFEDDKCYWNYLLNLVSSPIMDSSSSFLL